MGHWGTAFEVSVFPLATSWISNFQSPAPPPHPSLAAHSNGRRPLKPCTIVNPLPLDYCSLVCQQIKTWLMDQPDSVLGSEAILLQGQITFISVFCKM